MASMSHVTQSTNQQLGPGLAELFIYMALSQPFLTYFGIWTPVGHETTGAKFVRSRSRGFGDTRGAIFRLSL
jgi:hypothetical protein